MAKTKSHVSGYIDDELPITVAIADPEKIKVGLSIQRDYPLTKIERNYGIPFGRLRSNAVRLISDPDQLHGCKWSIEVHEAVFKVDTMNEEFIHTGEREREVDIGLSTGLGNVLQNLRAVAYVNKSLYHVVGEVPDDTPPYACLVKYSSFKEEREERMGVELILFNQDRGCQRIDKRSYLEDPVQAVKKAKGEFENEIQWAVSGYPLLLDGNIVPLELTAENVSDYRHVWRLPKLQQSLVVPLVSNSKIENANNNIEFYFGFEDIQRGTQHFVSATNGEPITLRISYPVSKRWLYTMCSLCEINLKDLCSYSLLFSVDVEFQSELEKGNIPNELHEKFKQNSLSLYDIPRFNTCSNLSEKLSKCQIPSELRNQFQENGIHLSDNANVTVKDTNNKWQIKDNQRTYTVIIRQGTDLLDIYDEPLVQKQEEEDKWHIIMKDEVYDGTYTETYIVMKEDDKLSIYSPPVFHMNGNNQTKDAKYMVQLCPGKLRRDFQTTGYRPQKGEDDVKEAGHFYIDKERSEITVCLLPAIYPHHIIGITKDGKVVNISISGLSGRTGITIESAKQLCHELDLSDALIHDNGNDVIARLTEGPAAIRHWDNNRQTRLTAALHFGVTRPPGIPGGDFAGLDWSVETQKVSGI